MQSEEEARSVWARVVPRALVMQAAATPSTLQQIGAKLDVHFLLRASVSRAATGYGAVLALVDAQTEHVIDTIPLEIELGPKPKAKGSSVEDAVSLATYRALRDEVARARSKPDARLDVRDLTLRAYSDWGNRGADPAGAYALAQRNIERALLLSADDLLALRVAAEVNLCECARAWASGARRDEMLKIGSKALDRSLELNPNATYMLSLRSRLLSERRHFDEAIAVSDDILRREPQYSPALHLKADSLYQLRRLPEALDATQAALAVADDVSMNSIAAQIRFAMRDDAAAIRHATKAISKLPSRSFEEPSNALILLYLAAAQARSGNSGRAKAALDEFFAAVPGVRSTAEIRSWMEKLNEPMDPELLAGLRQAGASD